MLGLHFVAMRDVGMKNYQRWLSKFFSFLHLTFSKYSVAHFVETIISVFNVKQSFWIRAAS